MDINVLGILFDSKLHWCNYVVKVINKANRALNGIKLINRFLTTQELLQFLTSNYYSIIYYNAEGWHLGTLKGKYKHLLLVASARAIRVTYHYPDTNISFLQLHHIANRATPEMFTNL
jgi:hypothetical protein